MNAVGIDVSKGISTVAIARPFGEIVRMPFDVRHTAEELKQLAKLILSLDGETRVVMENTGRYYEPVANALHAAGIFVCVVNAKFVRTFPIKPHRTASSRAGLQYQPSVSAPGSVWQRQTASASVQKSV